MKKEIVNILKELEMQHEIKILFAVESGSRAWGMESNNSDYDVRFVFARDITDYLGLSKKDPVITAHYDKDMQPVCAEGCFVDVMGFDIYKFIGMLVKSNPTCIEWLASDILYFGRQNCVFKKWIKKYHNPIALYYHYRSMCNQNYNKYIDSGNLVTYKKYLYAMRGLVSAEYIRTYGRLPSIKFPDVLKEIRGFNVIPDRIIDELEEIIRLKKEMKEKQIVQNYRHMDEYIESFLRTPPTFDYKPKKIYTKSLEKELLKLLYWDYYDERRDELSWD